MAPLLRNEWHRPTEIATPMIRLIFKVILFSVGIGTFLSSCGLQKEILNQLDSNQKEYVDFPLDYCNVYPDSSSFKKWNDGFNQYEKYLTREILKTQVGLLFDANGVQTWWCVPSVRPYVQLDTSTMILNNELVIGEWRAITNRQITYEDSASYAESKIYRTTKLDNENKEDDVFLMVTADKFKLYAKSNGEDKFKSVGNKNYDIVNHRYLMLFKTIRAASAVTFIGMDKENRLILNSYYVEERKVIGNYIVYQATMSQMIFKKMKNY